MEVHFLFHEQDQNLLFLLFFLLIINFLVSYHDEKNHIYAYGIILITFDTSPVSFGHDDKTVDYFFKSRIPIYSKNGEFRIDVKGKVYSKKSFTVLKKYSGGQNPFDLWHEYYPKVERDKAQSYLDDFI